MPAPLSSNLTNPDSIPYFLWDRPMTVRELHQCLREGSRDERIVLLARILREARDTDVWRFTTPREVRAAWEELRLRLGRRRAFWEFLLGSWQRMGLLDE